MTLIAHSKLPAFERLAQEGQEILTQANASKQDIRELHVGVFNMMPDAALEATERQFLRLVGSSNRIVQFYVHLFSPKRIERQGAIKTHVDQFYEDLDDYRSFGLDALIITGANPMSNDLTAEPFWDELCETIVWAQQSVTSVMCSCLATHAIFRHLYQERRILLPEKCWGVFSHQLTHKNHPLVSNINTKFDAPHSHTYAVTAEQAEKHGMIVLAESEEAGLHLAVTKDFRFVFTQGHPEYDLLSLLKEYKRELVRYQDGLRESRPPVPKHYFNKHALEILATSRRMDEFPEIELIPHLDNTWVDTGKSIFNNWLGLVYKITHENRTIRLMTHLEQDNPLGL